MVYKKNITVIILIILLIISLGYIIIDKIQDYRQNQLLSTYQSGYDRGIQDSVVSLYQQLDNCKVVPITIGNYSKQIIDVACLQQEG